MNWKLVPLVGFVVPVALAAPVYLDDPSTSTTETVIDFKDLVELETQSDSGSVLSISGRRSTLSLSPTGSTFADADTDLSSLSAQGSLTGYLYKFIADGNANDTNASAGVVGFTGDLRMATGDTGSTGNLSLILDLGDLALTVDGLVENQGVTYVTTVNSLASSGALSLDGVGGLDVDASRTGRVTADEFIEQSGGNANARVLLDLNSTLEDGATFTFAEETAGTTENFLFSERDSDAARLADTSYVINSAALRTQAGANEAIQITFSRAANEYIEKSFTRGHPSNNAALTLGTLAADGVALGDMQTALTELDINDFGFGHNADALATEVKRLAPIANGSFVADSYAGLSLAADAVSYRLAARRGNWSGYSELPSAFWVRGLSNYVESSGSVPVTGATSQDIAGHDGYEIQTHGLTVGADRRFSKGLVGFSVGQLQGNIEQLDDRTGEGARHKRSVKSIYGHVQENFGFVNAQWLQANGDIEGHRKTAVGRVAGFSIPVSSWMVSFEGGRRFDLMDGRTAITPRLRANHAQHDQGAYTETGAGDLSLAYDAYSIKRSSFELCLDVSHKRRLAGKKALFVLSGAVGRDRDIDDMTISAAYTGPTPDAYLGFTTPVEQWPTDYVKAGLDVQLELAEEVILKWGVEGEFRNARQAYTTDLSIIWPF